MEPQTNPEPKQPAPIMDVAPPAKPESVVATPPQEDEVNAAQSVQPAAKVESKKPAAPNPEKTSTAPVLAIVLAVLFFMVLSAAAYYAYKKAS